MFCPECGNHIEDQNARFCPECGTKIEKDCHTEKHVSDTPHPKSSAVHGIIFTNLNLLAGKMRVDEQNLAAIFNEFTNKNRNTESRTSSLMPEIILTGKAASGETRKQST